MKKENETINQTIDYETQEYLDKYKWIEKTWISDIYSMDKISNIVFSNDKDNIASQSLCLPEETSYITKNVSNDTGIITSSINKIEQIKAFLIIADEFMKYVNHHRFALKNKRLFLENPNGLIYAPNESCSGLTEKQYEKMENLYQELKQMLEEIK
jgi:secreted Zn-dependent insulinase-like peptidase